MMRTIAKIAKPARRTPRKPAARNLLSAILLALAMGLSAAPAIAQGCAMCYATAKATPRDGQLAINRGILVMLFPPIAAMTIGVGAAFRYGKKRDNEKN